MLISFIWWSFLWCEYVESSIDGCGCSGFFLSSFCMASKLRKGTIGSPPTSCLGSLLVSSYDVDVEGSSITIGPGILYLMLFLQFIFLFATPPCAMCSLPRYVRAGLRYMIWNIIMLRFFYSCPFRKGTIWLVSIQYVVKTLEWRTI